MNENERLIHHFYTCFQNRDYEGMQKCYADNATFSDPVFQNLNAAQVRKMWEMLIKRGKDMTLEFSNVQAKGKSGSADWRATYTFSGTGRKVLNVIHADFTFENGLIVKHQDDFSFYKWSKQALGLPGVLFGWTAFLRDSVRKKAMQGLHNYMNKQG